MHPALTTPAIYGMIKADIKSSRHIRLITDVNMPAGSIEIQRIMNPVSKKAMR